MKSNVSKPKVVSIYSGAGGIDIGFEKAGFDVVYSTDIWETACNSWQGRNWKHSQLR